MLLSIDKLLKQPEACIIFEFGTSQVVKIYNSWKGSRKLRRGSLDHCSAQTHQLLFNGKRD